MKLYPKILATAVLAALALVGASTASAKSSALCSPDALFTAQVGHLPAEVGAFRNELTGQIWRFYADQAKNAPLPARSTPTPCNPSSAPIAANFAKSWAHEAKFVAILSTFPGRGSTASNPTKAQWRMLLSEAALADVYGAAVLRALGGENLAATNWTARIETDRTWLIARAKAIR